MKEKQKKIGEMKMSNELKDIIAVIEEQHNVIIDDSTMSYHRDYAAKYGWQSIPTDWINQAKRTLANHRSLVGGK